jgi:CRP/FNR family transcriptional regulator, cyclic AMP receptor protein
MVPNDQEPREQGMNKAGRTFRDAIFIVTEERSCPVYNTGEEFKVEQFCLSLPSFKPGCLYLAQEIARIISSRNSFGGFPNRGGQKSQFTCGGCGGVISFEFKKERDFATLQMKLLNETEERRRRRHLDQFFGVLRNLDIFEPLDDDALSDLTLLLELRTIPIGKVIIRKGDPGSSLYIVLQGQVAVIADDGSPIAEMGEGKIFGEMSLLSGEPASNSVHTLAVTQVAMLSAKNFKHVLKKYPVLQLFLFKLLVDRAQSKSLRAGHIASGMTGELADIPVTDLFRLINSSRKTGTVVLGLDQGKAAVYFQEGEIVHARFRDARNKEAVYALLDATNGHFSYTKGIPEELTSRPPIGVELRSKSQ